MLVSPDIDVKDFRVLEVPVSDHFPLLLEFS
jgi:endonuclease/exonuclease/phosphatase (EEP) superfamily protein YafD